MNILQSAPFKQILLQQRQTLLQQLAQQRDGGTRVEAATAHRGANEDSHAQAFSERELELILDDRETMELQIIAAALQRIEDGSYGLCVDCGCDIPEARLRVAPEAPRCVNCQEQSEHTRAASP